uniref:SUEL-type lectin domain-containing protein n=1 Tax=Panagrellus redivivus TaxID=6233 RepID=A0A7E4W1N3_PANRE
MTSKTVVFAAIFLSIFTVVNAAKKFTCVNTTYPARSERQYSEHHELNCPSKYCYTSVKVTADRREQELSIIQRCGTAEEGNNKYDLNLWVRKGDRFVYVCDGKDGKRLFHQCNEVLSDEMEALRIVASGNRGTVCHKPAANGFADNYVFVCDGVECNYANDNDKNLLKKATDGKRVCLKNSDFSLLTACYANKNDRCVYTKNLESGKIWQNCLKIEDENLPNEGKCIKDQSTYTYICGSTLCNNVHTCDQLELGKPSPFDLPPPTQAPLPGQDSMQGFNKSNETLGPIPNAISSPKSTGSCSNLPIIVMLVLVVGIYFTV